MGIEQRVRKAVHARTGKEKWKDQKRRKKTLNRRTKSRSKRHFKVEMKRSKLAPLPSL